MPILPDTRHGLEALLKELQTDRIPIDMPRIERALIAILSALLDDRRTD
jgi:hypothetical protein